MAEWINLDVVRERHSNHVFIAMDTDTEEDTVFSIQSVPRPYDENKQPSAKGYNINSVYIHFIVVICI
jgi:hypothetical protein